MPASALLPIPAGSSTLDELPDGVLVVNRAGMVELVNAAFLEMVGRSRPEVLEQALEAIVAEEDMLHLVGFQAMFGSGPVQDGNVIFTAPDGSRRPLVVCANATRDQAHVVITARVSGVVQKELADVSRWAAVEQERALELTAARDALFAKNAALYTAQAELTRAYEQLKDEVKTRERLEHELRLAQRLDAIGQLSAGVAHEINTPLQYIGDSVHFLEQAFTRVIAYADELNALAQSAEEGGSILELSEGRAAAERRARLPFLMEEVPKALGATKEGLQCVSDIVRAMKSFANQDDGEKSFVDLNQAIRDALTVTQAEYKSIAVAETDLAELPLVRCFIGSLKQVLLSLIVNAAHAIDEAKRPELGKIRVCSRVVDDIVEITIADDGCGIREENRHHIFEQFFTTKEVGKGSGQALSVARKIIVDGHHGTLSFESETGVGTTFSVRIPLDGETPVPPLAVTRSGLVATS